MIHKILIILSIFFMLLGFKKKKKIGRKITIKDAEERMNKALSFLQHKKGTKEYNKIEGNIKASGIKISPETFQSLNIVISITAAGLTLLFELLSYLNKTASIEVLNMAAEMLNNPSIKIIKFNLSISTILAVFIIAYFLPRVFLKISAGLRKSASEKEILLLQSYAVIMLRANVPTKEILIALSKRARIFSSNFELAVKKYSTNPEAALKELKESSNSNNFRKTCIALEQSLKTDSLTSLKYLESNRVFTREINKQHRLRKNKRNEIIGTLLMVFPLFMLIAIGAYPWIIYILKLLNNIPM